MQTTLEDGQDQNVVVTLPAATPCATSSSAPTSTASPRDRASTTTAAAPPSSSISPRRRHPAGGIDPVLYDELTRAGAAIIQELAKSETPGNTIDPDAPAPWVPGELLDVPRPFACPGQAIFDR